MSISDDKTPWTDGYGERGKRIKELELENKNLKAERCALFKRFREAIEQRQETQRANAFIDAQILTTVKTQLDKANGIIKQALTALPVGNVTTHTPESIPERINAIVKECAALSVENEKLESERGALRIAFADASHSNCSIGAERFLKDGWLCKNHKEELYKLRADFAAGQLTIKRLRTVLGGLLDSAEEALPILNSSIVVGALGAYACLHADVERAKAELARQLSNKY